MTAEPIQHHPVFARIYAFMTRFGRETLGRHRAEMLVGLSGRVLEVGAGNGDNFYHYPHTVSEVVAVEPEPYLRVLAELAARQASVGVSVLAGVAEHLPFADASFDAAVTSLVLCSVTDPAQAIAELQRVIRPGGELRFFEHVRSSSRAGAAFQRAIDGARIWPAVAGGCHCARNTAGEIERRFSVEHVREVTIVRPWTPVNPFLIGTARRPVGEAGTRVPADPN